MCRTSQRSPPCSRGSAHHRGVGSIRLCANAGIAGPTALIEDIELEAWRRWLSVHLEGACLFAKHAIPLLKAQRSGAIILTSSTAGIFGYPNRGPYSASKWAVNGLMKTLAMELGAHGIRANSICPGAVEGPRMEAVLAKEAAIKGTTRDAIYEGYGAGTSMRSFVTAQDIAAMAVFLASDVARLVSGQIIAVDVGIRRTRTRRCERSADSQSALGRATLAAGEVADRKSALGALTPSHIFASYAPP